MTRIFVGAITLIGCVLVFAGNVDLKRDSSPLGLTVPFEVTFSKAYAGRGHGVRTTRRVARRTTRRVVRRNTLPHGCAWRAPYHYCGGVYYQPVVENNVTVYVVVYP